VISATTVRLATVVIVGGLVVGIVTSVSQGILPFELSPLANSAGSWSLATFALCLVNREPRRGAALGALGLLTMVLGYVLASELRGIAAGSRLLLFWGLVSIIVGPALGVAAAWIQGSDSTRVAVAAGLIGGVLVGEGIYGLTVVASSTPTVFWTLQVAVGLLIVGGVVLGRLRGLQARVLCLVATAATAAAFYLAYAANPIALLSG
jgi:hypothetical protein